MGRFDIDFTSSGARVPGASEPAPSEKPSLFTALREQLGLRLQPERAPRLVTIFERIEMPTED